MMTAPIYNDAQFIIFENLLFLAIDFTMVYITYCNPSFTLIVAAYAAYFAVYYGLTCYFDANSSQQEASSFEIHVDQKKLSSAVTNIKQRENLRDMIFNRNGLAMGTTFLSSLISTSLQFSASINVFDPFFKCAFFCCIMVPKFLAYRYVFNLYENSFTNVEDIIEARETHRSLTRSQELDLDYNQEVHISPNSRN